MSNQPILCEVSEVILQVSNRRASVNLRRRGVANVARCNCVFDVCTNAIVVAVQRFSRSGFVFKSLFIGDLQRPIHIIPSSAANLANHGRNLANWSLNLAISEANLASNSSFPLWIMAICEVSEVISLPSHVRTRTCARAGETVLQYRSGRKITSHNLVTSQLGFDSWWTLDREPIQRIRPSHAVAPRCEISSKSPNASPLAPIASVGQEWPHNASATMALASPKRWVLPQKPPRSWVAGTAARLGTVCLFCPTPSPLSKRLHYDHHFPAD
jgi:hypothetical protein